MKKPEPPAITEEQRQALWKTTLEKLTELDPAKVRGACIAIALVDESNSKTMDTSEFYLGEPHTVRALHIAQYASLSDLFNDMPRQSTDNLH